MNILPLVFSFLLIFSLFSHVLMRNALSFSSSKKNFCEHLIAKQHLRSKWECRKYALYGKKENKPSPKPTSRPKSPKTSLAKPKTSHRLDPQYNEKWNLSHLIQSPKPIPYLDSCCEKFLEILYGHTPFWQAAIKQQPDLAKRLIDAFKQKKAVKPEELSTLFPEDPSLQKVFYKMLKGSSLYDLKKKEGYPPLEDFFCLHPKDKKTLRLPQASYYAIEALLGKEIAQHILELEGKKQQTTGRALSITKQEISSLLETVNSPIGMKDLSSLIYFSRGEALSKKLSHKESDIIVQIPSS